MTHKFAPTFLVLAAALALFGCGRGGPGAAGSNLVFVTDEFGGTLGVVDGATGEPDRAT